MPEQMGVQLHGIDKKTPGKDPGYTLDNTVPRCWACNTI
jgi:hypothetical protein